MDTSTSKLISRIEDVLQLTNKLQECGYYSVFDIIKLSKSEFIKKHRRDFSRHTAEVYDLAVGFATQVSRVFRKNGLMRGVAHAGGLKGLQKDSPTYQSLFDDNWSSYCLSSAPEANDSPVSYLVWLYNQAHNWEINEPGLAEIFTLANRRPDIPKLMINDNAINQVIPALDVVNDVLTAAIESYIDDKADQTLAETRYPNLLPYTFPQQQTVLSLANCQLSLQQVIAQADTTWPYFLSAANKPGKSQEASRMGANLSPEQYEIITETEVDIDDPEALSAFYLNNFGMVTDSYNALAPLDIFTQRTALTVPQVEQLIAGTAGGYLVTASQNYCVGTPTEIPTDYGAVFINNTTSPPITIVSENNIQTDTKSEETTLIFSDNGLEAIDGKFGNALEIDALQSAQVYLDYDVSARGGVLSDFTLAFWCKIDASAQDLALITTNKIDDAATSTTGMALFVHLDNDQNKVFQLTVSDGTTTTTDTANVPLPTDSWMFVALTLDANGSSDGTSPLLTGYFCTDGTTVTPTPIDCANLGSILIDNKAWGFNGNLGNSYYTSYPDRRFVMAIDDITVWERCLSASEIDGFITNNKPGGGYTSMTHYYPLDGSIGGFPRLKNTSDNSMDRINRMVRLQHWLALPYDQVDLLLTATMVAESSTTQTMNANTVRMLGVFNYYQDNYAVTPSQFAAILHEIPPYAITPAVPFLDQIFNSPALFETPFTITDADFDYTDPQERIVKQLCAGLSISETQFRFLADKIYAEQPGSAANLLSCSLAVVSAFYRLVMLPRLLGLTLAEGMALMQLLGDSTLPQFAAVPVINPTDTDSADMLDSLMTLANTHEWLQQHSLSPTVMLALVTLANTQNTPQYATTAQFNLIADIDQQLASALLNETELETCGVPNEANTLAEGSTYMLLTDTDAKFEPSYSLDASKGQYLQLPSDINSQFSLQSDCSIGFWLNVPQTLTDNAPVICCSVPSAETPTGISIMAQSSGKLLVTFTDSDNITISDSTLSYIVGSWSYITLVYSTSNKQLTVYVDGTAVTLDTETFTGSTFTDGNYWAFNEDGALTYYPAHTDATLYYSDISLWNSALSSDQVASIISANTQVTDATYKISDEETYTINWMEVLSDLIDNNGLIKAIVPSDGVSIFSTIYQAVNLDIDQISFNSPMSDDDIANILTNLIYQTKLTQDGIANSSIAKTFNLEPSLPPLLLQWANASTYQFLSQSWTLKDTTDPQDPTLLTYLALLLSVGCRAGITQQFQLTPAMLNNYLNHTAWFGLLDNTIDTAMLYQFSRYADWMTQTTADEDDILAYLSWVNAVSPTIVPTPTKAAQVLAELLGWEASEVQLAVNYATNSLTGTDAIATTLTQVDCVMRLQTMGQQSGLSVTPLLQTAVLSTSSVYSDWQPVGESLVAAQVTA